MDTVCSICMCVYTCADEIWVMANIRCIQKGSSHSICQLELVDTSGRVKSSFSYILRATCSSQ